MHYALYPVVVRQPVQECVRLPFNQSILGEAPAPDIKFSSHSNTKDIKGVVVVFGMGPTILDGIGRDILRITRQRDGRKFILITMATTESGWDSYSHESDNFT